jgi:hypothetical protein
MASVLLVACRTMPRPSPVSPLARRIVSFGAGPSDTRATSPRRDVLADHEASNASGETTAAVVRTIDRLAVAAQVARRRVVGHVGQRAPQVGERQAAARQLHQVDVDPEDGRAVAVDLEIGDAVDGDEPVGAISSSTMRVRSCALRVAEVTAMRITGWASASALTTLRRLGPVGQAVGDPGHRVARVGRGHVEVGASANSSVTRLRPKRELDEIDRTPATRPTAPSIRLVTSWSTVSGEAPGKSVVTEMTGRSTSAARAPRRRRGSRCRR